jgi:hypothetical protein
MLYLKSTIFIMKIYNHNINEIWNSINKFNSLDKRSSR